MSDKRVDSHKKQKVKRTASPKPDHAAAAAAAAELENEVENASDVAVSHHKKASKVSASAVPEIFEPLPEDPADSLGNERDDFDDLNALDFPAQKVAESVYRPLKDAVYSSCDVLVKAARLANESASEVEFVLIGWRGSGKTALVEAILGCRIAPVGVTTRRPVYYHKRQNVSCTAPRWSLTTENGIESIAPENLEQRLAKLTADPDPNAPPIHVRVETANTVNFTLVDTPSLNQATEAESLSAQASVRALCAADLSSRDRVFVLVSPTPAEFSRANPLLPFAATFDTRGARTVCVFTKAFTQIRNLVTRSQATRALAGAPAGSFLIDVASQKTRSHVPAGETVGYQALIVRASRRLTEALAAVRVLPSSEIDSAAAALELDRAAISSSHSATVRNAGGGGPGGDAVMVGAKALLAFVNDRAVAHHERLQPFIERVAETALADRNSALQQVRAHRQALTVEQLRATGARWTADFMRRAQALMLGTSAGTPTVNGQTLEEEWEQTGFSGWAVDGDAGDGPSFLRGIVTAGNVPGSKASSKKSKSKDKDDGGDLSDSQAMPRYLAISNSTDDATLAATARQRLYGAAQLERLVAEFRRAAAQVSMPPPTPTECDAVLGGALSRGGAKGYARMAAASELASRAAGSLFTPLINQLYERAVSVVNRLPAIVLGERNEFALANAGFGGKRSVQAADGVDHDALAMAMTGQSPATRKKMTTPRGGSRVSRVQTTSPAAGAPLSNFNVEDFPFLVFHVRDAFASAVADLANEARSRSLDDVRCFYFEERPKDLDTAEVGQLAAALFAELKPRAVANAVLKFQVMFAGAVAGGGLDEHVVRSVAVLSSQDVDEVFQLAVYRQALERREQMVVAECERARRTLLMLRSKAIKQGRHNRGSFVGPKDGQGKGAAILSGNELVKQVARHSASESTSAAAEQKPADDDAAAGPPAAAAKKEKVVASLFAKKKKDNEPAPAPAATAAAADDDDAAAASVSDDESDFADSDDDKPADSDKKKKTVAALFGKKPAAASKQGPAAEAPEFSDDEDYELSDD